MPDSPNTSPTLPATVDVAINGGGLAGSSLAITLRRMGMEVVLIEREASFRDRVRGEAIHPWGVREVDALDLRPLLAEAGAVELPLWTQYRDRTPGEPYAWTTDVPDSPPGMSFSHPRLQEALFTTAVNMGVRAFRPASATAERSKPGWTIEVESTGASHRFHARLLVGADGRNSVTRKLFGSVSRRDPVHHQFGGLLLDGVDMPGDSAHQGYFDAGFAVVFPQGNGIGRAYLGGPASLQRELMHGTGMREFINRVAACFPDGDLANAVPAGPMAFFPNADIPVDKIAGDDVVVIGDAAGTNDPTQGHGTSLVFRDVRVLRDLLLDSFDTAPQAFADRRQAYYQILRTHAAWTAPLLTDTGEEADMLRDQVRRARELDPSAEGYGLIFATGPDGLSTDEETRRRFYGEHLPGARVRTAPKTPGQGGRVIGPPPE